ncbi:glycoside hydrolase family 88/105 protein [Paenibacillus paridis]|uniref:glycoside hydrolase family 88/105 protein n=1 Tax=Paenibacillus paridis TaxID=2583376 RepID=UPI0011200E14|nr:glycoside hydrolase family 88 protein [Paenibacillus paridis]
MSRSREWITNRVIDATLGMPLLEWNWSEGVALYGLTGIWKRNKQDERLIQWIEKWMDQQLAKGNVFDTINATAPCFALLELNEGRSKPEYKQMIEARIDFLLNRAIRLRNGAYEHTLIETTFGGQMWIDTLFMAGLFLAKAGLALGRPEAVEEGIRQFRIHAEHLQQENGLYFHGWDEGLKRTIGCQWARGNAWAAIVAVELLEMLPVQHEARDPISKALHKQLIGLKQTQDMSGLWTTVMTEPATYLETSAAAGIGFATAKGIRLGLIPAEFSEMGNAAMRSVLAFVDWNGALKGVSAGTAVQKHPGEYHVIAQDRMEGYGQGLLLMMLSELNHAHQEGGDSNDE